MANIAPFFITGANCKIKVNGVTLAFAVNLNYSVKIPHARARTLGSYESNSFEPLSYDVDGSFSIVRYIDGLKSRLENLGLSAPAGADNLGNGIGGWTRMNNSPTFQKTLGNGADGVANKSLIPAYLQDGVCFDIEVYQKTPDGTYLGVSRIRNARIVSMQANMQKRSTMMQSFQFIGQYLDEDSFIADGSAQH